jgi:hypothetical protein
MKITYPSDPKKDICTRCTRDKQSAQAKIQNQGHKIQPIAAVVALNQIDAARVDCRHEWTLTGSITDGCINLSKAASASLFADVTARVTTQGLGYDVTTHFAACEVNQLTGHPEQSDPELWHGAALSQLSQVPNTGRLRQYRTYCNKSDHQLRRNYIREVTNQYGLFT